MILFPVFFGVSLVPPAEPVFFGLVAYLLGCISFGYYLVRVSRGRDIRVLGSGNAGARNAGRVLGRVGFMATLLGDAGKGALAVVLAGLAHAAVVTMPVALGAVVAGHIWPAQLGFRGGKGFATAAGGILALDYRLGIAVIGITILLLPIFRRGTPAALGAAVSAPVLAWLLGDGLLAIGAVAAIAVMILLAHARHVHATMNDRHSPDEHGAPRA
jgi:glycerol-3-phosphate acyltransferase PlsY